MGTKSKHGGLDPIRYFADENPFELRCLERLRHAWPVIAGPIVSRMTHPISIRHGLLLVGCHDTHKLKALRATAETMWPRLQDRIGAMLKLHLQRIEVTPSDADAGTGAGPRKTPIKTVRAETAEDPLEAVLNYYRRAALGRAGHRR